MTHRKNTARPRYYDAVSCLLPHIASRIVDVRQCRMHLDSLLMSHRLGALMAIKPGVGLTKCLVTQSLTRRCSPCPGPPLRGPGPQCTSCSLSHAGSGFSPSEIIFPLFVFN